MGWNNNEGNLSLLGEWPPQTPRTQAFVSTILGGELPPEEEEDSGNKKRSAVDVDSILDQHTTVAPTIRRHGVGLADRIAARNGGFTAPKINTWEIISSFDNSTDQLSPSAFQLESPVFLFNTLVYININIV